MKRKHLLLLLFSVLLILFNSCKPEPDFDETMLLGTWSRTSPFATETKPGDEFYRYDVAGTGATWDTADDVQEEEAQPFNWSLTQDQLRHDHQISMGGVTTKVYTVTTLTTNTLIYEDEFGVESIYSR